MDYLKIKNELYDKCVEVIDQKLSVIHSVLNDAQQSANNETKSTAGDKHDTARAMAHLESEKNAAQLNEINKLKKVLPFLANHKSNGTIELGSLVITSGFSYYISISLGKIIVDNHPYFAISPVTPIARLLIGKKVNDQVIFNGQKLKIKSII